MGQEDNADRQDMVRLLCLTVSVLVSIISPVLRRTNLLNFYLMKIDKIVVVNKLFDYFAKNSSTSKYVCINTQVHYGLNY